jgi:hypothetical protein
VARWPLAGALMQGVPGACTIACSCLAYGRTTSMFVFAGPHRPSVSVAVTVCGPGICAATNWNWPLALPLLSVVRVAPGDVASACWTVTEALPLQPESMTGIGWSMSRTVVSPNATLGVPQPAAWPTPVIVPQMCVEGLQAPSQQSALVLQEPPIA